MKTYSAKPLEVERKWYVIDAEGEILGRLAVRIANILRGKINLNIHLTLIPVTLLSLLMLKRL